MPRLSALLLALAFVATGCDATVPSATANSEGWGGGGPGDFCSEQFTIAGPNSLASGQTATYTVTSESTCSITDVDWNVGFNGTLVSSSGASAQIQAGTGPGSVWIEANVTYVTDGGYLAITEIQRGVGIQ